MLIAFQTFFVKKILTIWDAFEIFNAKNCLDVHIQLNNPIVAYMTEFQPTTISEVKTVIMGAPSSSCEQDPIPTSLIKEFLDDFAPYLTKIVNLSLSTGIFPSCLQHAIVKPLLKKSNLEKQQLKNYRPIANLKCISTVIERVASARLTACISDQNLQNPFQSAYRKSNSVETALLKVQNDILVSMDEGKIVGHIVLLDFKLCM